MLKKSLVFLICMLLTITFLASNILSLEQVSESVDNDCPCIFGTISDNPIEPDAEVYSTTLENLPSTWDWRDVDGNDWTTPIKDQLQDVCGSCWAFGALAGMESYVKIWADDASLDVDLSEQYMLSCSPGDCNGWYWTFTLKWLKENGAIPESCLSYEADDTIPCDDKCSDWRDYLVGIDSYHKVSSNVSVIKSALVEFGPLPCTMSVYEDFYPNFEGGVYQYSWGDLVFGHCVSIVGYDDTWGGEDEGYWIVKNSWGTEWGEDGWFRIAYGECKIEKGVYYYTGPNYAPERPDRPSGPEQGIPGGLYTFSAVGLDPDVDIIKYCFDWGDGNIDWSDFVNSGETVSINHTWAEKGSYDVMLMAEDEHGLQSDWSDPLVVSMPRGKITFSNTFIQRIFEQFPNMFTMLRYIF